MIQPAPVEEGAAAPLLSPSPRPPAPTAPSPQLRLPSAAPTPTPLTPTALPPPPTPRRTLPLLLCGLCLVAALSLALLPEWLALLPAGSWAAGHLDSLLAPLMSVSGQTQQQWVEAVGAASGAPTRTCMAPLPTWELQRVSLGVQEADAHRQLQGDAPLAIYPAVHRPPACGALTDEDVVLTTHLTTNRLQALALRAERWFSGSRGPPARGCMSVAVLLCEEGEWQALQAARAAHAVLREHAQVTIVLGAWVKFYPYNVMRNAAMEPWVSAHAGGLAAARHPACARVGAAAHAAAMAAAAPGLPWTQPGCLDPASPPQRVTVAGGGGEGAPPLPRPWLIVLDADGLMSCSEVAMKELLARASQGASVVDRAERGPPARRLFTFLALEAGGGLPAMSAPAVEALQAVPPGDPHASLAFVSPLIAAGAWGAMHGQSMLTDLLHWTTRPPSSAPALAPYALYHVGRARLPPEPYFAARPPLPYFPEQFRGRYVDKQAYWFELAFRGEYTANMLPACFILMDSSLDDYILSNGSYMPRQQASPPYRSVSHVYWSVLYKQLMKHAGRAGCKPSGKGARPRRSRLIPGFARDDGWAWANPQAAKAARARGKKAAQKARKRVRRGGH